jgi:hypothetical protein
MAQHGVFLGAGARAAVAAAALVAATACAGPPDPPPVVWDVACGKLNDFVLSGWARSPEDVWFVGGNSLENRGLLLHYDGTQWVSVTGVTDKLLWWVWGASSTDVWAVGEDATALHFKGGLWSKTCALETGCNEALFVCIQDTTVGCFEDADCPPYILPTLYGVWGTGPDAVWAVGGSTSPTGPKDVFLFWNGEQWIRGAVDVPSGESIFKVWGAAPDDVWAVGTGGVIFHFTGSMWLRAESPTEENLIALYGTAANDIWAVGGIADGVLLHYDGNAWTIVKQGFSTSGLNGVYTSADTNPVIVGFDGYAARVRDGAAEPLPTGIDEGLHGVFGDGSGIWAVGGNLLNPAAGPQGVILRFGLAPATCDIVEYPQPIVKDVPCGSNTCSGGAGTAGPGEPCNSGNDCECMEGLDCWYWVIPWDQTLDHFLCAAQCANSAQCQTAFGAGAHCCIPGPQVASFWCHPDGPLPLNLDACN